MKANTEAELLRGWWRRGWGKRPCACLTPCGVGVMAQVWSAFRDRTSLLMDEITYDFLWMPVVSARSKAEVFGVSVHGCRRCGVEGDGEDGGPAVDGVGRVEGAAQGFDALLGLDEAELG